MATVRVPIDITWTGATGSPGVNVWHARTGGVVAEDENLEDLLENLRLFYSDINNFFPDTCTISFSGEVSGVGDDAGDLGTYTPWSVGGVGGAAFLPPANQMIVNWRATTGGRSGRGKTFIGPLVSTVSEGNGTPVEARVGELQVAANNLIAASAGVLDGSWGVYSRTQNVIRDHVTSQVPNVFAVLRSRRD